MVAADAAWEAGGRRLLVTVEAMVDGDGTDADEAANFHRVWSRALRCFGQLGPLRFDVEGSIPVRGADTH